MNTKIRKMNNYLLDKNSNVFLSLIFLIIGLIIFYVFFLLMSVSYTYAEESDSKRLNNLITKNVNSRMVILKKEQGEEKDILENKFVKLDLINYIKTSEILVVNLQR